MSNFKFSTGDIVRLNTNNKVYIILNNGRKNFKEESIYYLMTLKKCSLFTDSDLEQMKEWANYQKEDNLVKIDISELTLNNSVLENCKRNAKAFSNVFKY